MSRTNLGPSHSKSFRSPSANFLRKSDFDISNRWNRLYLDEIFRSENSHTPTSTSAISIDAIWEAPVSTDSPRIKASQSRRNLSLSSAFLRNATRRILAWGERNLLQLLKLLTPSTNRHNRRQRRPRKFNRHDNWMRAMYTVDTCMVYVSVWCMCLYGVCVCILNR